MDSSEFYNFEGRNYINPTLSSSEQMDFINRFRDIQSQNNQAIANQTKNLGTNVPSNLGGLGQGNAYFASRYQTPQVGEMVASLESAAQAQALNDIMSNYQAQLKKRYNDAYRSAQKRANSGTGDKQTKGDIEKEYSDDDPVKLQSSLSVGTSEDLYNKYGRITTEAVDVNGQYYVRRDDNGNIVYTNQPGYKKGSDGFYHPQSWFDAQAAKNAMISSPVGQMAMSAAALLKLMNGRE